MPRIPQSEIDRIKSDVSLLDWIRGQGYGVSKQGKDYALSCPFHDDDMTWSSFLAQPS